jgi:3-phenylpropionate/cinnamic acid dioxygenase small subunit
MPLTVEDRIAIHELIALHGHLVDSGEFERLGELFTPDVVYDLEAYGSGSLHGIDEIAAAGLSLGAGNPLAHHVTNTVVSCDGDVVTARSKGLAVRPDGSTGSVVYDDVLRQERAGWRIARRTVVPRREPLRP